MSRDSNGQGKKDPWGNPQNEGPPDLLEVIKKFFSKSNKGKSSGGGSAGSQPVWKFVGFGAAILAVLWVVSGIFLVAPAEQAVILRFGKYVSTVGPGPHWIPPFVESRKVVNVQQVSTFPYQAEMLTKDENIVSVALAVQYRINNPEAFLFNVVNPINTLHQATSSALRQVVGQMTLNAVLTIGRQQLRDQVAVVLNQTLALYNPGIEVTDVTLQPAKPPEAVTQAFDDAIKAREDEQRYINQAQAYVRKVISIVKGNVARLQQSAMAYKQEVVLKAQGKVARYEALLKPYEEAPVVTRERLYLDTVSSVLAKTSNIIVDSKGNNILYLPLNQLLKQQNKDSQQDQASANQSTPEKNKTGNVIDINNPTVSNFNRPSYPAGGTN